MNEAATIAHLLATLEPFAKAAALERGWNEAEGFDWPSGKSMDDPDGIDGTDFPWSAGALDGAANLITNRVMEEARQVFEAFSPAPSSSRPTGQESEVR